MANLNVLWHDSLALLASGRSSQKCHLRLLDTVIMGEKIEWYYTTKNGSIARKKDESITNNSIVDRFTRFSLANQSNINKYVAASMKYSQRIPLNVVELSEALNDTTGNESNSSIQVYLRPYQGLENYFIGETSMEENKDIRVLVRNEDGKVFDFSESTVVPKSPGKQATIYQDIINQIKKFINEIINHIDSVHEQEVVKISALFILDDNCHVWLSNIESLVLKQKVKDQQNHTDDVDDKTKTIPVSSADSSRRTGSRDRDQRFENEVREAADSVGRGELILREGKTILCALGPDELPGLRAWTVAAVSAAGSLSWKVDMSEYAPPLQPDPAIIGLRKERAVSRHTVKQPSNSLRLLLLKAAEDLLLGRLAFDSPESFVEKWQGLLRVVQLEGSTASVSAREVADVTVCGNTLAVLRKLESLMNTDFEQVFESGAGDGATIRENPLGSNGEAFNGQQAPRNADDIPAVITRSASVGSRVPGNRPSVGSEGGSELSSRSAGSLIPLAKPEEWGEPRSGSSEFLRGSSASGRRGTATRSGQRSRRLSSSTPTIAEENHFPVGEADHPGEGNGGFQELSAGIADEQRLGDEASPEREAAGNNQALARKNMKMGRSGPRAPLPKRVQDASTVYSGSSEVGRKGKKPSKSKDKKSDSSAEESASLAVMMAQFAVEKARLQAELDKHEEQDRSKHQDFPEYFNDGKGFLGANGRPHPELPTKEFPLTNLKAKSKKKTVASGQAVDRQSKRVGKNSFNAQRPSDLSDLSFEGGLGNYYGFGEDAWGTAVIPGSIDSTVSRATVMSASEAQFMKRNAGKGSLGGDAGLMDDHSIESDFKHFQQSPADKNVRKDLSLVQQVQQLQRQLKETGEDLERSEEAVRRGARELEQSRQSSIEQVRKIQEAHQKELILLRESHARELANIANMSAPSAGAPASSPSRLTDSTGKSSGADAIESHRHLLNQLEVTRNEMRKQQEQFALERKQLQLEYQAKQEARDRASRADVNSLRNNCTTLEDKISNLLEELSASNTKCEGLLKMCRNLESAKQEAVDAANKLRLDLKGMQQAVTSSYRLESAQGMTAPADPDTIIRMHEAKLSAKERQMDNKLEFMKAQLAAEQAIAEELRGQLTASQSRVEEAREECRIRLREADMSHALAIEETERRLEAQFESKMSELTSLQAKMAMLQGQMADAFQDGAAAKAREEGVRSQLAKAMAQTSAVRSENEALKGQIEELRQARDISAQQQVQQQATEAVLRRLDNERQYLRSQLATEVTHKTELQKELTQCQATLADTQRQWRADVDQLRETAAADTITAARNEQILQESNVQLDAEANRLRTVVKELKEGYSKTRDLLRLEQLALEAAKAEIEHLNENLRLAHGDMQRMREAEDETSEMHKQQLDALAKTMEDQEEKRVREMNRLKEELSKQFLLQSSLQQDTLVQRTITEKERRIAARETGVRGLVEGIRRWRRGRLFSMFRQWSMTTTLINAAEQYRNNLKRSLQSASDEAQNERQKALEALRSLLKNELEIKVAETRTAGQRILEDALDLERRKASETLQNRENEMEEMFSLKEREWEAEIERLRREVVIAVEKEQILWQLKLDELQERCRADLVSAAEENRKRCEEIRVKTVQEEEKKWKSKLSAREVELDYESSKHLAAVIAEHTKQKDEILQESARKVTEKESEGKEQLRNALTEWMLKKDQEMVELKQRWEEEMLRRETEIKREEKLLRDTQREQLHEESEGRVRELRSLWKEELAEALVAKEKDLLVAFDARVVEIEKAAEVERQRAVKVEAQKWQAAAKDAQRRFELDLGLAGTRGWEDRDAQAKVEMEKIRQQHSFEIAQIVEKCNHAKDDLEKSQVAALEHLQNSLEAEREEAVKRVANEVAFKKDEEWKQILQKKISELEIEYREVWEGKLRREQERLNKLKEDFARQGGHHAQERQELLDRLAHQEDIARRMEADAAAELEAYKRNAENEAEKQRVRFEKSKERAIAELKEEMGADLEAAEARLVEESRQRIQEERDKNRAENERQMAQLQNESERLVSKMEDAMDGLRKEKLDMSQALDRAQARIEAAEDAHYDLTQTLQRTKMEQAIAVWRLSVGGMRLKSKFSATLRTMQTEAEAEKAQAVAGLEQRERELETASCRLVALIAEMESMRKRIQNLLTNHKAQELLEKRTQLRVKERDILKLGEDMDSLEAKRDQLEEELDGLQLQVRDIEEQIREHSRSSAVQNGRINVSHARKKRRLDGELERFFDLIEQKREEQSKLETAIAERGKERDEREGEMVEAERGLMGILVEQQRLVLQEVSGDSSGDMSRGGQAGSTEEKVRLIVRIGGISLPVHEGSLEATLPDVSVLRVEAQDTDMRRKAARL